MDVLYYSNYCKHCQKLLQYLAKNGLTNKINCINIDRRVRNHKTGQFLVLLESGTQVSLPPNVHSVPALLLVNDKFSVIIGNTIYAYLKPTVSTQNAIATNNNGEPESFVIGGATNGTNITSEQYTFYNMSSDELGAKGRGGLRQLYNYVSVAQPDMSIYTPPDTYRPDKITDGSLDSLVQARAADVAGLVPPVQIGINDSVGGPSPPPMQLQPQHQMLQPQLQMPQQQAIPQLPPFQQPQQAQQQQHQQPKLPSNPYTYSPNVI